MLNVFDYSQIILGEETFTSNKSKKGQPLLMRQSLHR